MLGALACSSNEPSAENASAAGNSNFRFDTNLQFTNCGIIVDVVK
jgi:hypothetical protein